MNGLVAKMVLGALVAAGGGLPAPSGVPDAGCCAPRGVCSRGEPYLRATHHGLLHYPHATYWTSWAAPSPWAYESIAPYPHHYHFFYGHSYGWDGSFDCRN